MLEPASAQALQPRRGMRGSWAPACLQAHARGGPGLTGVAGTLCARAGELQSAEGLKDLAVFSNAAPIVYTPDAVAVGPCCLPCTSHLHWLLQQLARFAQTARCSVAPGRHCNRACGLHGNSTIARWGPELRAARPAQALSANTSSSTIRARAETAPRSFDLSNNNISGEFPQWLVTAVADSIEDVTLILTVRPLTLPS